MQGADDMGVLPDGLLNYF